MKRSKKGPSVKGFAEYKPDGHNWITLATGEYYPDILKDACELYKPVLVMFGQMLKSSESEDDRTGGYRNCADEVLGYAQRHRLKTKVVFLNDGPGLLLGSMWGDYAALERSWAGKIRVITLRMVSERITLEWLRS